MREAALLSIQHTMRDALRQRRTVLVQHVLLADAQVLTAEQEAEIGNVVAKMMMREEQVVDLRRINPRLHQLVRSSRPAVKHKLSPVHVKDIRRPEPRGSRRRRACPKDVEGCGDAGQIELVKVVRWHRFQNSTPDILSAFSHCKVYPVLSEPAAEVWPRCS